MVRQKSVKGELMSTSARFQSHKGTFVIASERQYIVLPFYVSGIKGRFLLYFNGQEVL